MGSLTDQEMAQCLSSSAQIPKYSQAIDRNSAREMLAARMVSTIPSSAGAQARVASSARGAGRAQPDTFEKILKSPLTRTVAGQVTRGLLGALLKSRK
jgi:hypothetical protein